MTDWVRLWHDMPTDPKWRTIARKSKQRVGDVIAVFNFLMVNASGNASERGKMSGFDCEDVASALDLEESDVQDILEAMRGKVIDDDDRLSGWEKRQPKREDSTASARKAAWKERHRNASERTGTQGNAPETETETDIQLANANCADEAETPDPAKVMFDSGIALLRAAGKNEAQARSILGKWRKDHGPEAVIVALGRAQREGAMDPVGFIQGVFRSSVRNRAPPEFALP